ncbi:hypothetical protein TNCT_686651 [Trichonephila clavata]|uniref:Uncharacterized protein n=1 Tax=Trichonephila clavata TaxID=2740835 RepID=A0A8X6FQ89_TRICU|nr:hypothetical protein TNCT_686651 [Trichonephila clavata]
MQNRSSTAISEFMEHPFLRGGHLYGRLCRKIITSIYSSAPDGPFPTEIQNHQHPSPGKYLHSSFCITSSAPLLPSDILKMPATNHSG